MVAKARIEAAKEAAVKDIKQSKAAFAAERKVATAASHKAREGTAAAHATSSTSINAEPNALDTKAAGTDLRVQYSQNSSSQQPNVQA